MGSPRGAQLFAKLLHVCGNRSVRDRENFRHAAIVQFDLEDLRSRIALREFEDVLEVRAAPRVDRLRVVAHNHDVFVLRRERVDEVRLDLVRVLIFIDENEFELPPIKRRDLLVLEQHAQRFLEQIVEVHRVGRFLLLLVARVHIFDLLEQRQEIRKLFREQFLHRPSRC